MSVSLVLYVYMRKQEPLNCDNHCESTVKYCMDTHAHTLKFNFHTITNSAAVDALVYALSIELFLKYRIECVQPADNVLEFTSARDCTFAQLALSNDSRFTLLRLDSNVAV